MSPASVKIHSPWQNMQKIELVPPSTKGKTVLVRQSKDKDGV